MNEGWRIENFYQDTPGGGLEYVSGQEVWKNLFYGCIPNEELEEWLCLPKTWCFLLSGEGGTGKTYLAKGFAAEMGRHGYRFLLLDGMDFVGKSEEETIQRVEKLFRFVSTGESFFILIQGMDRLPGWEASIAFAKEVEKLKDQDFPVVITALTENQKEIFPALQRVFYICQLLLPDEAARIEYFTSSWSDSFLSGKPKFSVERMAEITEGLNYTQLELIRMCATGVMWKQGKRLLKTTEAFRQAVESGGLQLSEKRFRQITALVRRGGILQEITSETETDGQSGTELKVLQSLAAFLQSSSENAGQKAEQKGIDLDGDDLPKPAW